MKRAIVVVILAVLGGLYLYSAFGPGRPGRARSQSNKIGSVRRVLHAVLGIVLLIGVLFLIYAAFLSSIPDD